MKTHKSTHFQCDCWYS